MKPDISGQAWFTHFSNLLMDTDVFDYNVENLNHNNNYHSDILNTQISEDETHAAVKKINPSKSPGPNGILGHFITSTQHITIPTLTRLLNAIFDNCELPKLWSEHIICPIHKSGSVKDTKNYRGISLSNILYKVFANILNTGLCR